MITLTEHFISRKRRRKHTAEDKEKAVITENSGSGTFLSDAFLML